MESTLFQHAGAQGIRLIETLGWDGTGHPRLQLHLARLARGAQLLGYPCDLALARGALMGTARGAPTRCRLTLGADGGVQVATAPMPQAKPVWNIALAPQRLDSADPYLRIKSTQRAAYDAARAAMAQGLDEVILLNERGEVADGSITTLFFDRGQGMRTPPLSSGALPGILRQELACPEETLFAGDMAGITLWVGNSLRGLMPARYVQPQP